MKTKINITRREGIIIGITLLAGLFLGWAFFHSNKNSNISNSKEIMEYNHEKKQNTIWTCSMHPQIRMDKPGKCPICGMDLIPLREMKGDEQSISPDEIQMTEAAMKLADVQTVVLHKDYPDKEIFLLGKVKPDERNISELTARFGGRIEKLYVNFTGQTVSKGEKLTTVYSPALVTAQRELLESLEYKESNPELYKAARNKLKLWDLTNEQINSIEQEKEAQLYFDVLSPISGTVTMRHVALGDYVNEGTPLFQVINLSHVWVMFEAYESDLPWIRTGDKVRFSIKSLPSEFFEGRITFVDPVIDPKSRIARVRVELNNPGLKLKPEMYADGVIISRIASKSKDILVPKTAILWTGKRSVVYVKVPEREQPTFINREIVLGPEAGKFYVVEEGLSEGEEVAMNGVFKIDAAAQLEGKPSMMNPEGGKISTGHQHGNMDMGNDYKADHSSHSSMEMNGKKEHSDHQMEANNEYAIFKVFGNCEMCKERIEKAANSVKGVNTATWDIETKMIKVSFNHDKTSLNEIHKAIAKVGHDTEKETAPLKIYDKLPECCLYRLKAN